MLLFIKLSNNEDVLVQIVIVKTPPESGLGLFLRFVLLCFFVFFGFFFFLFLFYLIISHLISFLSKTNVFPGHSVSSDAHCYPKQYCQNSDQKKHCYYKWMRNTRFYAVFKSYLYLEASLTGSDKQSFLGEIM